MASEAITRNDLTNILNEVLPILEDRVQVGGETNLGTVTLGSGGYASFTRPTLPSGAILIGYQVAFGSCTGAWNIPPYYGTNAYVIGTPNATITNLRIYPIYYV